MPRPEPAFTSAEDFRAMNRRMADAILAAEPEPYRDGGYVRRVLQVRGRRSGSLHLVPIAVVSLDGAQFVVSPVRDRNWVQNLLADPRVVVLPGEPGEHCDAVPEPDAARAAAVIHRYVGLMDAPWAVAQFPFPPDATVEQIEEKVPSTAVFRLDDASPRQRRSTV